ncbi:zinc metalloprotease HtpX [Candidatus Wolfebacteria bacterium CG10_big_fil_rev_8_21_14_0_10_31_9]|uniref:Protease HtpX homolog n=1 Tax=Candidatus Wolfebacteria bacterium CG10_big_fil_rev_8_21_14_0_10_31_9 TaxID=1975070 RepID=A0A2H0RBX2_9BACT|nr:MAG: zinc metalloprotease HtpX [Candidatus Wolfebacteria bacterium CG10_big_fil_rev_8_21_14_0_10_31_9]
MTLYNQKDSNIRKTWLLFVVFLIVIIGIGWAFSYIYNSPGILYIAIIFSLVMNLISYWYSDKIVLKMNKAILVERKDNPDLYNIVENLSITAGLPIPKIFIVNEEQLNAFATGRDPQHAVVAVTVGLLRKLNKTELEGVLAHELSHIGNRDILISTVAVVLVGFISILGDMFFRSMFWGGFGRRTDREGGQAGAIIMIIGVVLAILAPITATLIQLAISRKRELLADASGALLTRYPDGLISALEKISLDTNPMKVANNTTAHLWLDNPFKGQKTVSWMTKLFLTHPPIEERIKALKNLKI